MGDSKQRLVTRGDIARLTGVSRPAVTNWARRHDNFPAPVGENGDDAVELFSADEVLGWLDTRAVPANARRPGEAAGTTFGDRFRAELGESRAHVSTDWLKTLRETYNRHRGAVTWDQYLAPLPGLLFTRLEKPALWRRYLTDAAFALTDQKAPPGLTADRLRPLLEALDRDSGGSRTDGVAAFDQALELLRDSEHRSADEFFTPVPITRVMTQALVPESGTVERLHDPFCRSGELLAAWLEAAGQRGLATPAHISGRTPDGRARSLARMTTTLHGARHATFSEGGAIPVTGPTDPPGTFDLVLSNPPFNMRMPGDKASAPYWRYGRPSGHSSNFDWLQYALSLLTPEGRAAMVMPAGAAFTSRDGNIRRGMVEDGAVEAVVALPGQLFAGTGIAVHLWFLKHPSGRADGILFVDGGKLGTMASRTRRTLTDPEMNALAGEVTSWRRARSADNPHPGTPGVSRSVSVEEIARHEFRLDPAFHVHHAADLPLSTQDVAGKQDQVDRLTRRLRSLHDNSDAADRWVTERLKEHGL